MSVLFPGMPFTGPRLDYFWIGLLSVPVGLLFGELIGLSGQARFVVVALAAGLFFVIIKSRRGTQTWNLVIGAALLLLGVSLVSGAFLVWVTVQEATDDFQGRYEEMTFFIMEAERVDPSAEPGAVVELDEQDLEEYPALRRVPECTDRCESRVNYSEGYALQAFLQRERSFSVDLRFEEELNRGEVSPELREAFRSHDRSLSRNATVVQHGTRRVWTVRNGNRTFVVYGGNRYLRVRQDPTYFEIRGSTFDIDLESGGMMP